MTKRARRALIGAAAVSVAAACVELGGPKDGVVSISSLKMAYPSVVVGEILRDSLGAPAPLSIVAFGPSGEVLDSEAITFLALDSTVSVDPDGTVHGLRRDTLGGRVVATAGGLQTPPLRVIVTVAPTTVTRSVDPTAIAFDTSLSKRDSTAETNASPPLTVTVVGAGGVGVQGFIVSYALVRSLTPVIAGTPTAYLADDAKRTSPRDTTSAAGIASRRVIIRQAAFLDAAWLAGTKTDTIIIRATVRYLGADVPGSPIDFIVPVSKKP